MNRRMFVNLCITAALAATVLSNAAPVRAENWPHWRGPSFDGASPEKNLPTKFSMTQNVRWTADLPGASASTPIIYGDRVFVSSVDGKNTLMALCFDRRNGSLVWKRDVAVGPPVDSRSNMASPSPVTDGKTVAFFYGSGAFVGFTVEGEKLWQRSITREFGEFSFQWTFSSSPTMFKGRLYLPVLQRNAPVHGRGKPDAESFILAVNPQTGKTLWRQVRPSKANAESRESFASIVPFTGAGRDELLVIGGDALTGHDPATGKELWRWGTWNPTRIGHWRLVPSAVAGGGVILTCTPKHAGSSPGAPLYAIKVGLKGNHEGDKGAIAWSSQKGGNVASDVCTPLYYNGLFYVLHDRKQVLSCVEPKTGKVLWETARDRENLQLGRTLFRASPTGADGKVYLINHAAHVWVIDAAAGKTLHETDMSEGRTDRIRSSIAVSHGNLFIKVDRKLYCIGGRGAD